MAEAPIWTDDERSTTPRPRRRRRANRHAGDRCDMCGGIRVVVDSLGQCALGHQVLSQDETARRQGDLQAAEEAARTREEERRARVIDLALAEPHTQLPTAPSFATWSPSLTRALETAVAPARTSGPRPEPAPGRTATSTVGSDLGDDDDTAPIPVIDVDALPAEPLARTASEPGATTVAERPLPLADDPMPPVPDGQMLLPLTETDPTGLPLADDAAQQPSAPQPSTQQRASGPLGIADLDPEAESVLDAAPPSVPPVPVDPLPPAAYPVEDHPFDLADPARSGDVVPPRGWGTRIAGLLLLLGLLGIAWYLAVTL